MGAFSLSLNSFRVTHFVANHTPGLRQRTRLRPHFGLFTQMDYISLRSQRTHTAVTRQVAAGTFTSHYLILLIPNSRWGFSKGPLAQSGMYSQRSSVAGASTLDPTELSWLTDPQNPEVYSTAVRCSRDPVGPLAHQPNRLFKHNNQQLYWPAYSIRQGTQSASPNFYDGEPTTSAHTHQPEHTIASHG